MPVSEHLPTDKKNSLEIMHFVRILSFSSGSSQIQKAHRFLNAVHLLGHTISSV